MHRRAFSRAYARDEGVQFLLDVDTIGFLQVLVCVPNLTLPSDVMRGLCTIVRRPAADEIGDVPVV